LEESLKRIAMGMAVALIISVLAIFLAKGLRWLFGYGGTNEKTEKFRAVDKEKEKASMLASLLTLDDSEFVSILKRIVIEEPLASCVMILVADTVLDIYLQVSINAAHKNPSSGLPTNLKEYVIWAEKNQNGQDMIGRRRFGWFIISGLIKIASAKACVKSELQDDVLDIWVHLINGGAYISEVLKRNIIWTDDEKVFFSHIQDEKKGVKFVLNQIAPSWVRQHSKIQKLFKWKDLNVPPNSIG